MKFDEKKMFKLQELHFSHFETQTNIHTLTKATKKNGQSIILASSLEYNSKCDGNILQIFFHKNTLKPKLIVFDHSEYDIVCMDSFMQGDDLVLGIVLTKMNTKSHQFSVVRLASTEYHIPCVQSGMPPHEIPYLPFLLRHAQLYPQMEGDREASGGNDEVENVFIICGGDKEIHVWREEEASTYTEVASDRFPEFQLVHGIVTCMDIQTKADKLRLTAVGTLDGTVCVFVVCVKTDVVLQHISESYDGVTTSIHLFKMHEEDDEEEDYYSKKIEVCNKGLKNEVNGSNESKKVENSNDGDKEDCVSKKPIRINFGITIKDDNKENESINKILDNTSLLVTNSFNPAQLYSNIFNTKHNKSKTQNDTDNTPSHSIPPSGFSKPHQLQDSNEYDCVQCALVADVDMDGCKEIILGTYGQELLFYKHNSCLHSFPGIDPNNDNHTNNIRNNLYKRDNDSNNNSSGNFRSQSAAQLRCPPNLSDDSLTNKKASFALANNTFQPISFFPQADVKKQNSKNNNITNRKSNNDQFSLVGSKHFNEPIMALQAANLSCDLSDQLVVMTTNGLHVLQTNPIDTIMLLKSRLSSITGDDP